MYSLTDPAFRRHILQEARDLAGPYGIGQGMLELQFALIKLDLFQASLSKSTVTAIPNDILLELSRRGMTFNGNSVDVPYNPPVKNDVDTKKRTESRGPRPMRKFEK